MRSIDFVRRNLYDKLIKTFRAMLAKNFRSRISSFLYKKKISFKNNFINLLLDFLKSNGYTLAPKKNYTDYHITEYRSYKEYRDTQIYYNKMKINKVFADKKHLQELGI